MNKAIKQTQLNQGKGGSYLKNPETGELTLVAQTKPVGVDSAASTSAIALQKKRN